MPKPVEEQLKEYERRMEYLKKQEELKKKEEKANVRGTEIHKGGKRKYKGIWDRLTSK